MTFFYLLKHRLIFLKKMYKLLVVNHAYLKQNNIFEIFMVCKIDRHQSDVQHYPTCLKAYQAKNKNKNKVKFNLWSLNGASYHRQIPKEQN